MCDPCSEESASCSEDDAPERRFERRVDRWSCDAAAQDRRWQGEQDEAKVQHASATRKEFEQEVLDKRRRNEEKGGRWRVSPS